MTQLATNNNRGFNADIYADRHADSSLISASIQRSNQRNFSGQILVCLSMIIFGFIAIVPSVNAATINKPPLYLSSNNGLVGYWTFNGPNMTENGDILTSLDLSGNANNGTSSISGPTRVIGRVGQGLLFNSIDDDYVDVATSSSLSNVFTGGGTFGAWIKANSGGESDLGVIGNKSINNGWFLGLCGLGCGLDYVGINFNYTFTGVDGNWVSDSGFALGTWTHVMVVYDNSSVSNDPIFYINGVRVGTLEVGTPTGSVDSDTASKFNIGNNTMRVGAFDGTIDEVRVYNRALSANEIATLYNSGAAKFNVSPTKYSTTGLVGYWTMDGSKVNWKTGAVTDSSGRGNTGTITNMATSTGVGAGKIGQALNFDGVNDYVNVGDKASLEFPGTTSKFSITAWVKLNSTPTKGTGIASKYNSNAQREWYFFVNTSRLLGIWMSEDGGSANFKQEVSTTALEVGEWTHVGVTIDFATDVYNLYINGVEMATTDSGVNISTLHAGTAIFMIGALNRVTTEPDNFFPGLIDEVRVYNRALSANEIKTLYNSGAAKFNVSPTKYSTTGLVGYWTMDGSKVDWKTGAVTDSSGRGNTGTITNMATSTGIAAGKIGQALNFDNVDDFIKVSTSTSPSLNNIFTGGGTVGAWIKAKSAGEADNGVIENKSANEGWIFALCGLSCGLGYVSLNLVDAFTGVDGNWVSNSGIDIGTWTHVMVVYDNSSVSNVPTFYINGLQVGALVVTTPTLIANNDATSTFTIGNFFEVQSGTFDGLIDDVRVYNRALGASEVGQLYNAGR